MERPNDRSLGVWTRLGAALGRFTLVYAIGAIAVAVAGIVSLAVLTRYLEPSQFGRLAVLMVIASLLGVIGTLGLIQGVNLTVWGSTGGDDDGVEIDLEVEEDENALLEDKRRAFMSALVFVVGFSGIISGLLVANSNALARTLVDNDVHAPAQFRVAVLAGWLGAIWRLLHNVPRLDRRPKTFALLGVVRPMAVLAASIPLVATGHGVYGAALGVAIGTALAIVVGLWVARGYLGVRLSAADARRMEKVGRPFLVMGLAIFVTHNADTWLLSAIKSDASVGLYRVASRAAILMSYVGSAFLMAWGPLTRTAAYGAVKNEKGAERVHGIFLTYYLMALVGFLLILAVGADVLIRIAAPAYRDAADVLPLIALGFFMHSVFIATYRFAAFPNKIRWIIVMTVFMGVVLVAGSFILIPPYGRLGAAASTVIAFTSGAFGMYQLQRHGPTPIQFERWRVVVTFGLGLGVFGLSRLAHLAPQPFETLGEAGALLAYPLLLVATGAVPRANARPLLRVARNSFPNRGGRRRGRRALAQLGGRDVRLLRQLIVDDAGVTEVAERRGMTPETVLAEAAMATAQVADVTLTPEHAPMVGRCLYATEQVAVENSLTRMLLERGQNAQDLDEMVAVARDLARVPASGWNAALGRPAELIVSPPPTPGADEVVLITGERVLAGDAVGRLAAALAHANLVVTVLELGRGAGQGATSGVTNVLPAGWISRVAVGPLRPPVARVLLLLRARRMRDTRLVIADGAQALSAARAFAARNGAAVLLNARAGDAQRVKPRHVTPGLMVAAPSFGDADALRARLRLPHRPVVLHRVPELPRGTSSRATLRADVGAGAGLLVLADAHSLTRSEGESLVAAVAAISEARLVLAGADTWAQARQISLHADVSLAGHRVTLMRSPSGARVRAYASDADVVVAGTAGRRVPDLVYAAVLENRPVVGCAGGETARALAADDRPAVIEFDGTAELRRALQEAAVDGATRGSSLTRAAQGRLAAGVALRAMAGTAVRAPSPEPRVLSRSVIRQIPALARRPRGGLRYVRGRLHLRSGDSARATTQLAGAQRADPGSVRVAQSRAAALRAAGRDGEARTAFREIIAAAPGSGPATAAAINLARLGDRDGATAVRDTLLREASARQLVGAAEIDAALRAPGRALTQALAALEQADGDPAVLRGVARVLDTAGEPTRALELARRVGDGVRVRRLAGVRRTLDADWQPAVPWAPFRIGGVNARCVLNLLETSLPHAHAGYVHRATTVLEAQRRAGFDPVAVTRLGFPASRGVDDWGDVELVDGVVHHRLAVPGLRYYTGVAQDQLLQYNADLLAPLVRRLRPAVVMATTPHLNGLLALALSSAFEIPFVYDVRGFPDMTWGALAGGQETEAYALRRASETRCMNEAHVVVTLSHTMRDVIVGRGVDPAKVHVVPHAVDTHRLRPGAPDPALVHRHGLEGKTVIGYVGSVLDYEGLDVLLDALVRVRRTRDDAVAVIVGDGAALPALRQQAERLGLADHVRFTGRLSADEAQAMYALFDIVCVPRRGHEVCHSVTALKPFEVMATGACLLVSDVAALAEVADHGRLAAMFTADDAEDCARVLLELIADPGRREAFGQRARTHVERHHSHDVLARAMGGALDAALDRATDSGPARAPLTPASVP